PALLRQLRRSFWVVVDVVADQRPCHTGGLVGQRDRYDVAVLAGEQSVDPTTQWIGLALRGANRCTSSVHQKLPQIRVSSLTDPEDPLLASSTVVFRGQPHC